MQADRSADPARARTLSPTDIAQFIRLEQCERYLRLRLDDRAGRDLWGELDVAPQSIPPLLTRSGAAFEARVERDVRAHTPHPVRNLATEGRRGRTWLPENDAVLAAGRDLAPGAATILFQPRLQVPLAGWTLRGEVDILRLSRDTDGSLHLLIADMKSSNSAKIEHRLQVAFYHEMLAALFGESGVAAATITLAILYRGPSDDTAASGEAAAFLLAQRAEQRAAACELFGTDAGLVEWIADPSPYLGAVHDLVTGPEALARRVASADFDAVPFHLTYKCDGCLYQEYCLKQTARRDDLSLIPTLTQQDKGALQGAGVATTRDLASLKDFRDGEEGDSEELVATPGREALVRRLAATWPVGPRLDELVHRAKRYRRWQKEPVRALSYIPSKGYGSLPYCAADHNPNLVRVYLDVQHDYLHDRLYLLGALVVACQGGVEARRQSIVHLAEGPPDSPAREEALFIRWLGETIAAIAALAARDEAGEPRAPIHLIFWDDVAQRRLLEGLGRHAGAVLGATPLYDFLTQLAAFDSPVATCLDREIRELKNFPLLGQSLQAVAALQRFDWNAPEPYRDLFRARLFDARGKLDRADDASPWFTSRARFSSQLPLEYAYAAWGDLETPRGGGGDDYRAYRAATPALLTGFEARRLEALAHVAASFAGNDQTTKTPFRLPDLATWEEHAHSLAEALDEFVTIERHVALGDWKARRLAPPERRVLAGETLIVRYLEADQEPGIAEANRDHAQKQHRREGYEAAYRAANPDADRAVLSREQAKEVAWSHEDARFRLRLELADTDCDLEQALALTTLRPGDSLVLARRWEVDTRLTTEEQEPYTPTPKQLLYDQRVTLEEIVTERDDAGKVVAAHALVTMRGSRGGAWSRGFAFASYGMPLVPDEPYTLDPDPNDFYGYWCAKLTEGLRAGGQNALYARLTDPTAARADWPDAAAEGQARFLAGLDALHAAGAMHDFEPGKRAYIGQHGDAPTLLVQGPPGTGKSYATAFALFARLQGALAADRDYRVFLSCKTHAATDVLLANVVQVQRTLRRLAAEQPALFARHFDPRLLTLPLFRVRPRGAAPDGAIPLFGKDDAGWSLGQPKLADAVLAVRHCVVASPPGRTYNLLKEKWPKALFGHGLCDCLVLDEASQLNLPEALLAALPLKPGGHLIVVGDHRQMPPIVRHAWGLEPRRTFRAYRAYESLFLTLLPLGFPLIQFAESFRLHAAMAEFLRREVYHQDGIPYHSRRRRTLPAHLHEDPFIAAALAPDHPLVVIVHDEAASQVRNPFEQALIAPLLAALADPTLYALDPDAGLGVVVPHRAQRAELQARVPALAVRDPRSGAILRSAVDTVERFQGDERAAIVISATESDRAYLLASSQFLLDPRRLTVALSRAKEKLILVAARNVFNLFSADEETFAHAQLWKNLLRHTCTIKLWEGERDGQRVTVWGNAPLPASED